MARSRRAEERILSADERELVGLTHHPELKNLPDDDLADAVTRLRERRRRASDMAKRQRRELRGKARPSGAAPAADDAGTRAKAALLAAAVKRANKERERRRKLGARRKLTDNARRTLAMKRAAGNQDARPESRTAGEGMRPTPNEGIAPSGALDAEGFKPVLERSRKVR